MPELKLRFAYRREDWLANESPAIAFWGMITLAWALFAILAIRASWWGAAVGVPAWFLGARKFVGILVFLVGEHPQTVLIRAHPGGIPWISEDEGKFWTPVDRPTLYERGRVWTLVGNGGGIHVPIPCGALTPLEMDSLRAYCQVG